MQLTEFIQKNHRKITADWVAFARTLTPWATGMSDQALLDHADQLLTAIVTDMRSQQTRSEQADKAKGLADDGVLATVGQKHAAERLHTGLPLDQLVSEYRALRGGVLRLWAEAQSDHQGELTRFNEAIDETLAEAATRYSEMVNNTREQFMAILGHDLRNPLGAITMGARLLTKAESLDDKQARVATRILNSAERMSRMVRDLLDLTRSRLGGGIPIAPQPMDLTPVLQQVIAELEAVHPDCQLRFAPSGDLRGVWDGDRMTQVLSNLVANAVEHGCDGPVSITAQDRGEQVVVQVHNVEPIIPAGALKKIFDPMVRQSPAGSEKQPAGLGLGLYIAHEVVTAHGGTIDVTSTPEQGTTFTVKMPRRAKG